MIKIGLAGLGFMGQMHLSCYNNNPDAQVVAVADANPDKLSGKAQVAGNIEGNAGIDLSAIRTTDSIQSLLDDPSIDLVDFCLPTKLHAVNTIAALRAGKHVLCEKPMSWTVEESKAVVEAQAASGKALLIGHCLRFWPQYIKAHEIITSGRLGDIHYARFSRVSGSPKWSQWLMDGEQSGGAVMDMHVHDIDTALWWFGKPETIVANGFIENGLPIKVDADWKYSNGLQLHLYGAWDNNGGDFAMGFDILGSKASLVYDSSQGEAMKLWQGDKDTLIETEGGMGYQPELDYLIDCIKSGTLPTRTTPESSRHSVEVVREELRQIGFKH